MVPFNLYYRNRNIKITTEGEISLAIRLVSTTKNLFLLSNNNILYIGEFENEAFDHIDLKILKYDIIDIDINQNIIYIVKKNGCVYKTDLAAINDETSWEKIKFSSNDITDNIYIKKIKCNSIGALYITAGKELYGSGCCGDVLQTNYPKKLEYFKDTKIYDISAGEQFFIIVCCNININNTKDNKENISLSDIKKKVQSTKFNIYNNCSSSSNNSISSQNIPNLLNEKLLTIENLVEEGHNLIATNVFSFGIINDGLLGVGDHIKRSGINSISSLYNIGVCSVSCGLEHSVVKTIDGRVYHWGSNYQKQINPNTNNIDYSSPIEFQINNSEQDEIILEICCCDYKSTFLDSNLNYIETGKNQLLDAKILIKDQIVFDYPILLSTKDFFLQNSRLYLKNCKKYLILLKSIVQKILKYQLNVEFIILIEKQWKTDDLIEYEFDQICFIFIQLTNILTLCLHTTVKYFKNEIDSSQLIFIKYVDELLLLFEKYKILYCDIKSICGFDVLAKIISDFDVSYCTDYEILFETPFKQISNYIQFLEYLIEFDCESSICLKNILSKWKLFINEYSIEISISEKTQKFWQKNSTKAQIMNFKQKHRRVIINYIIPNKLINTNKSITLFSDILCQWDNQVYVHPLNTVWFDIKDESGVHIITPERIFQIPIRTIQFKSLWRDSLQTWINISLGRERHDKLPISRKAGYKFSDKHSIYPGVRCFGQWYLGKMHGICHLEYPDEKIYYGEMRNGEIEGHGKMLLPSIGLYEGSLKAGKYHGYGIYEMKENQIYEGNFYNGVFHGHGSLRTNTYNYIGEFVKNEKKGYGVFDDISTGNKYMGMFDGNKFSGPGMCITMNGDYFEGNFINGIISGSVLAVFENGRYYEGELTLKGPCGKGSYYIPEKQNENDSDFNKESSYVLGTIISGNLSGEWKNLRTINATVLLDQKFSKYPKTLGMFIPNNENKIKSLFQDWNEEIFSNIQDHSPKKIWSKIVEYITFSKEKEKFKENDSRKAASYFAKNITMESTYLQIEPKNSTTSLYIKNSTPDVSCKRKFHSNETLHSLHKMTDNKFKWYEKQDTIRDFKNFLWLYEKGSTKKSKNSISDLTQITNPKDNSLELIPNFETQTLTKDDISAIKNYLLHAFKNSHHPLCVLNQRLSNYFYTAYGCWKVKPTPILSSQAMNEWESISLRLYEIVQLLFPGLPKTSTYINGDLISHITIIYPIVLSEGIYSTLFVLYANKYSQKDEIYHRKLKTCEKMFPEDLLKILNFDKSVLSVISNSLFNEAVNTLKQLKQKYSPHEMIETIEKSIRLIEKAHQNSFGNSVILAADGIMPLAIILIINGNVPHLGAELALLEDLMGSDFETEMSGFAGYCYTTIKATYEHIISSKFFNN